MSATYPAGIRTWTTKRGWYHILWAAHMNDMQDEIHATQVTLGVNPHISYNNPGGITRQYGTFDNRLTQHARGTDIPIYRGRAMNVKLTPNTWTTINFEHRSDPFHLAEGDGTIRLNTHGLWLLAARAEYRATGHSLQKQAGRRMRILVDGQDVGLSDFTGETSKNSFALHNHITWPEVLPFGTRLRVQIRTDMDAPPHDILANVTFRVTLLRTVDAVNEAGKIRLAEAA